MERNCLVEVKRSYLELAIAVFGIFLVLHLLFAVSNIYLLTQCDFEAPYKAEILRIGAFFVPLGTGVMTFVSNESLGEPSSPKPAENAKPGEKS